MDASRFPLELPCRLSRSVLWRLQRRYFERRGIAAWSDGEVPHRVTNSPYLARSYRRVIAAFLRDWQPALDPSQPVYVLELGAGAGRLAFHLVRELEAIAGELPDGLVVRYVMTDFAESTVAAWRAHPQLAAWLDAGRLDLARFDAEHDAAIALEHSGATLAPGALRNPLVVIANYVFDSLPLDAFSVIAGRLHAWQVRLCSTQPDVDLDDPDLLERGRLTWDACAVDAAGYYGDPALDRILDEHRALDATAFTFPSAALGCLARLSDVAGGRLLVLSADKGDTDEDALRGQTGPNLTLHGSFSVAVNYHAIARFVQLRGGAALLPGERARHVASCAFVLGTPPGGAGETREAYADELDTLRVDHLLALARGAETAASTLSLDGWIAHLAFHVCDPAAVAEALPYLAPLVGSATADERTALLRVLARCWDSYLHIGEPHDLGLALGRLAAAMSAWPEAIRFFEGSLRWHGLTDVTLGELARCHDQLDRITG